MPDRVQVGPCSHSATAGVRAWAGVCKSRRMYVRAYVRRWFIVGQRLSSRFSGSFLRWFCVRRAGRRVAGDVRSRVVRPVVVSLTMYPAVALPKRCVCAFQARDSLASKVPACCQPSRCSVVLSHHRIPYATTGLHQSLADTTRRYYCEAVV